MLTRRQFLKLSAAAGAATFFPWGKSLETALAGPMDVAPAGVASWQTAPLTKWVDALPIPPVARANATGVYDPLTKANNADLYEMEAKQSNSWQFHRDLNPAPTWGYWQGSTGIGYLGPTIVAKKNTPVLLKMVNNLPAQPIYKDAYDKTIGNGRAAKYSNLSRISVHLHGGFTAPQVDGHPDAWFGPGGQRGTAYRSLPGAPANGYVYSYSNQQPATLLWYHDHAAYQTRVNPFSGLAAGYVITDDVDTVLPGNGGLNIPKSPYDIPLVVQDRTFYSDGSMFYPTSSGLDPSYPHPIWQPEYFGDTPVVNGKAYPVLDVEPRRYRVRFLNGSQARFYNLALGVPMWLIGTEGGLLPKPVQVKSFLMAPAERFDVIVDFSAQPKGAVLTLSNNAPAPYPGGGDVNIPEIMRFRVSLALQGKDTTVPPASIAPWPAMPTLNFNPPGAPVRDIILKETTDANDDPTDVRLNGRWFLDPVEELPVAGTTELWNWVNLTVDAHPMHTHMFMFQVIGRVPFNVNKYTTDWFKWIDAGRNPSTKPKALDYATGKLQAPAADESGLKDTVKAYPGYITRVVGQFKVPPGAEKSAFAGTNGFEYVYHCHILEHEENEMMRPFTVI